MSLIYEPRGRAREYAALACNVYRGCDHRCTYCYAPGATFTKRERFGVPALRDGLLAKLEKELAKRQPVRDRVLLCFTCDPYQQLDVKHQLTRRTIHLLHDYGYRVQALTKGGSRSLRDLDLLTPDDAIAASLTSLDDATALEWEPGAALPNDRLTALEQAYRTGIPTWASLEPVLDPAVALEIIRQSHGFVDLFKIGRLNYHPLAKTIDWRAFALSAIELLESLSQPYYIKSDLRQLIPAEALGPYHRASGELPQNSQDQSQSQPMPDPIAQQQLSMFPNP